MSATKSIVSLAIGLLLDEGKLRTLDEPVATFFPQWRQGSKARITIGQLLNHTSGLAAQSDSAEIYAARDSVELALAAAPADEPGSRFFYNNKAVNLLPAIVEKASGENMVDLLNERLFDPLGIRDVFWGGDQAGNPYGMAGLEIHPVDFAKIGQVLLDGGVWQGRRILSASWISRATGKASQRFDPTCGLLWWLKFKRRHSVIPPGSADVLRKQGTAERWVSAVLGVEGRPYPDVVALLKALRASLGEDETWKLWQHLKEARIEAQRRVEGAPDGFAAEGYLGQYLLVLPSRRLVAVRMAEAREDQTWDTMEFTEFEDDVRALVP